jgi:cation diffusion facilitator family transporter
MGSQVDRGIRQTKIGLVLSVALAGVKLIAGIVGNAYALVADAIESIADVAGSIVVWGGLAISAQPADEDHPYGHGKAEALAGAAVAVLLFAAAVWIAVQAIAGIRNPHEVPAWWTLAVLVGVVITKALFARRLSLVGAEIRSTALRADAWHHFSDAITSAAAFIGIALALWGSHTFGGESWAAADEWAALVACPFIAYNGWRVLRPALHDLMDRMAGEDVVLPVRRAAEGVPGVLAIEKLLVRKAGLSYRVTVHVQAAPTMPLMEAHELGHRVQNAIREQLPEVDSVLVHMEPFGERPHAAT